MGGLGGRLEDMGGAVGNVRDEMDSMRQQLADLQNAAGGMTGELHQEMSQMREEINQLAGGLKSEMHEALGGLDANVQQ